MRKAFTKVSAVVGILMLVAAGSARADLLLVDADALVPVNVNHDTVDLGTVCLGSTASDAVLLAVQRKGAATVNPVNMVFADGAEVKMIQRASAGDGLEATFPGIRTVTLPTDWSTLPEGSTRSDAVESLVTLTPAATGAFTGEIKYHAVGLNAAGEEIFREADLAVTASVVDCDTSAPVITETVVPPAPDGNAPWYVSNVDVSWDVQDPDGPVTSKSGCDPTSITSDTSGTTLTCEATSAGGTASKSVTIKRDATPPTVTCPSPPPVYALGSAATLTAGVSDATSGPSTTTVTAPAATSVPGPGSVMVTGSDNAGNSSAVSCAYQVVYSFAGFFAPVANPPAVNTVKAGSTVPLKFSLGGNQGMSIFAPGHPKSQMVAGCNFALPVAGTDTVASPGASSLTYGAAGHYHLNWKTEKAWAGTCRTLVMTLADGTTKVAFFKLTK